MTTPVTDSVPPPVPSNSVTDYERPEELLQRYHLSLKNAVNSTEILNEFKMYKYDEARGMSDNRLLAIRNALPNGRASE